MTLTQWNFDQLELGEGARWINGRLVVVDLLADRVLETRGDVPAPFKEIAQLPVPVGAVAPVRDSDELMAAFGTGAGLLGGPQQESFAGVGMRVNDAVADPSGRFWVTTMAQDTEPGTGALHRLGSDSPVLKGLTIPNGPAFSHDGKLMYLADSAQGVVHRFDVGRDGELGTRRVFLHTPHHTPDGMTTDVAGNVWIAFWGASVVRRYRQDGRLDQEVRLPARQPTSVCLGGPDMARLFITTAKYGLRRPTLHDGALFAVDVNVPGRPANEYVPAHLGA
ncbi:SMP-30/gluconolactonase/LRE family protein [Lentzea sp. PSKA42]|uniref:SMP-30/gluconolactonase/LRE family protein n=1 Tax=Lentzea indica TaxID=2604800 RepID=A0ABX1FVA9_9PSEU|nr:SMP-30/gluconolactonase/LRE family protein [Lentzea indica]NKE62976.1 SMP-30/gluconolactonase/LRE family protein [Lentzea indica]